jgi:acyl dehydratase
VTAPSPYRVRARNLAVESENKIHDDAVAAGLGFAGGLVPGVELFAYAAHPFVAAWGTDFLSGGSLRLRFRQPVYDGDHVVVVPVADGDGWAVSLTVGSGEPKAVGAAEQRAAETKARQPYAETPLPGRLHPTTAEIPAGPLGSVTEQVDPGRHDQYLDGISESHPLFRDDGIVHPGALLRMVNDVLMQNVDLGPWIHTSSDCRFLAPAQVPSTLQCHVIVTECFERNGNAYVRYDALVVSDGRPVAEVDHTAIYRLRA